MHCMCIAGMLCIVCTHDTYLCVNANALHAQHRNATPLRARALLTLCANVNTLDGMHAHYRYVVPLYGCALLTLCVNVNALCTHYQYVCYAIVWVRTVNFEC